MERKELNVNQRQQGKGVCRQLRREGAIPAVLYGTGREPTNLSVDKKEMGKILSTEAGWNILIDLNFEGKDKVLARISDYQADVMSREISHIDFQVLDLNKKIRTEVPIKLVGEAIGVKEGGIMEVSRRSLEIRCFPTNIPSHIDFNVSNMVVGDSVHINDITLPEGVECAHETNFSIAAVVAPTKIIEAVVPEEVVEGVEGAVPAEGGEGAVTAEGKESAEGEKREASEGKKKE